MIARASQLFLPTLRDDPGRRRGRVSHKLLVRGGFIRQVERRPLDVPAARLARAPEGRADHPRGDRRDRRRRRCSMPVLTPAELWETTGRYAIPEVFKLQDRAGPPVRPADHARGDGHLPRARDPELQASCRRSGTTSRQGPRRAAAPRRAAPRARVHHEGRLLVRPRRGRPRRELPQALRRVQADLRALRARGATRSQAESGMMGGSGSEDFLAPSGSGENTLVTCENGDYAADLEIARGGPVARPTSRTSSTRPRRSRRPASADDRGARRSSSASTRARRRRRCRSWSTARSCSRSSAATTGSNEMKLLAALGRRLPARRRTRRSARRSAPGGGSIGPVGVAGRRDRRRGAARGPVRRRREPRRLAPPRRRRPAATTSRDSPTCEKSREGDACPRCGGQLRLQTAIEVGHIFKLETRYSEPLGATFLDEDGTEKPLVMGSYGIGPGRVDGRRGRAAPRRARDRLAARRSRRTTSTSSRCPGVEEQADEAARVLDEAGAERPAGRPRRARGREVRRRRPDRPARCA